MMGDQRYFGKASDRTLDTAIAQEWDSRLVCTAAILGRPCPLWVKSRHCNGSAIVVRRLRARLHRACRSELVSMFVKAEGPSGRAKIHSDDPKHALSLAQYLRAIGYSAWIEDTNGNEVDET